MNEVNLNDLVVGETCWTLPWACFFFDDELYLNSRYPAYWNKSGTAELLVKRVGDGYLVDFSHTNYQPKQMVDTWRNLSRVRVVDVCHIKPSTKLSKIVWSALRGKV